MAAARAAATMPPMAPSPAMPTERLLSGCAAMGGLLSRLQDRNLRRSTAGALFRLGDMDAIPIRRRRDRLEEVDARLVGVVEMIELAGERAARRDQRAGLRPALPAIGRQHGVVVSPQVA